MVVKNNPISLPKQLGKVKSTFAGWSGKLVRNSLILEGKVKPTALSPEYTIEIKYTLKIRPIVKVLSPELKLHPDKDKLPHIF